MSLPNFLIVGAQKSGTTTIYRNLQEHPDVYFSALKEPKFFVSHIWPGNLYPKQKGVFYPPAVNTIEDYRNLFKSSGSKKRIGEASVGYLYYYKNAIPKIKEIVGDIRIIIILRNPVERAFSAYKHALKHGERMSFVNGVAAEQSRINTNFPPMFHYTSVGKYHNQVEAYLNEFKNVHVILLDDLISDAKSVLRQLQDFLALDCKFMSQNLGKKFNESRGPKTFWRRLLLRVRTLHAADKIMPPAARTQLLHLYSQETDRLSKLLNRDLSGWKL